MIHCYTYQGHPSLSIGSQIYSCRIYLKRIWVCWPVHLYINKARCEKASLHAVTVKSCQVTFPLVEKRVCLFNLTLLYNTVYCDRLAMFWCTIIGWKINLKGLTDTSDVLPSLRVLVTEASENTPCMHTSIAVQRFIESGELCLAILGWTLLFKSLCVSASIGIGLREFLLHRFIFRGLYNIA